MATDRPRVSVLIPCYRHAQLLPVAVESLVAQTYPHWECVIVNDGSPDDTSDVARQLIARFPQHPITLVEQSNRGLPASRNAGAAASSGELLLPLDADDLLAPQMLEKTCAALEKHPDTAIAYTDLRWFGDGEGEIEYTDNPFAKMKRVNTLPVTSLFRRSLFVRVNGYRESMRDGYEDWDFWLGCAQQGARAVHVPGFLFLYRVSSSGLLSHAQKRDAWLKACLINQHKPLFTSIQKQWAQTIGSRYEAGELVPPLDGQSFAASGLIPTEGEARADQGSLAIWDGDISGGVTLWAEACCQKSTSYHLYAQISAAVDRLGLRSAFAAALESVHPVSSSASNLDGGLP